LCFIGGEREEEEFTTEDAESTEFKGEKRESVKIELMIGSDWLRMPDDYVLAAGEVE
jgi:hypothetical protein